MGVRGAPNNLVTPTRPSTIWDMAGSHSGPQAKPASNTYTAQHDLGRGGQPAGANQGAATKTTEN